MLCVAGSRRLLFKLAGTILRCPCPAQPACLQPASFTWPAGGSFLTAAALQNKNAACRTCAAHFPGAALPGLHAGSTQHMLGVCRIMSHVSLVCNPLSAWSDLLGGPGALSGSRVLLLFQMDCPNSRQHCDSDGSAGSCAACRASRGQRLRHPHLSP